MADGGSNNDNVVCLEAQKAKLLIEAKKRYKHLHTAILATISSMLGKSKLMPIDMLGGLNPSFTDLVKNLKNLRNVVSALAEMLELDPTNDIGIIDEYIELAEELAMSIDAQNSDSLCAAIAKLDDKPYV